jgi:hypothetical protein
MVSRLRQLHNSQTTNIIGTVMLCALVTSCGLEEFREVPRPVDSVVLSNEADAGALDAHLSPEANESGPMADEPSNGSTDRPDDSDGKDATFTSDAFDTRTSDKSANHEPVDASEGGPTHGDGAPNSLEVFDAGGVPSTKCGIPQPHGAPLCDPVAQCGCEGIQHCAYTPNRQDRFTCISPGDILPQHGCDFDDDCVYGAVCNQGLCMTTCETSEDCSEDTRCVDVPTADGVEADIRVCHKPCDPLDVASCSADAMCAATSGEYPACVRSRDDRGAEERCADDPDCAPGFGCTADKLCRAWCTLEGDPQLENAGLSPEAAVGHCPPDSTCEPSPSNAGMGQCTAPCPIPDVEGSECSVVPASCGCREGETCHVETLGKTACEPPGSNGYMTWCDRNSQCAAGFSCLAYLCRPVCERPASPCVDGSVCERLTTSDASPLVCLGHCDPVNPESNEGLFTACGVGAYCSPGYTVVERPESHCLRETTITRKQLGESCEWDTDCSNGLGCNPDTETCARWCATNEDCGDGVCAPGGIERTRMNKEILGFCD